ncbi:hypothetical protein Tco_0657073 [Tanacetum coccineum]|uniref:Uncharacterized protein n=1 Tax=Tanacetum coccineum TaxID=301880 RepID=A0ABQ4XAM0_9ASTR
MSSSTSDYVYPIIVPSDSDIEDAFFSTNTPDYTPASPDYFSASPGNTSPDSSDSLSKDLLAALATSPLYNDPYMQTYNAAANEPPIPPQALIDPPPILPSQKRTRPLSPSFTNFFALPQVFEMGESSHKMHLKRHEEQNQTIPLMSYLSGRGMKPLKSKPIPEKPNEMAPKRTSTSATPTMTQAAIRKLVADSIAATLEEAANIAQRLMDQVLKHGSVQRNQ